MAKAKKAPVKKEGPKITPSLMFRPNELFISYTFKRKARELYKLTHGESDSAFDQCLHFGLITPDRIVYPGIQSYRTGPNAGALNMPQTDADRKKV